MRTLLPLLAVAALALALGFVLHLWRTQPGDADQTSAATVLPAPRPLPEFALLDQDGRPFTADRLRDRWSLLFFGFTHCPDVCPNTLGLLQAVKAQLGDTTPLQVVLVSVDPGRDTPPVLKEYLRYFDPAFVGVTGRKAELDKLTNALYVPYAHVPVGNDGGYQVEHSGALVLVNARAQAIAYFSPPHQAQRLADSLRAILEG